MDKKPDMHQLTEEEYPLEEEEYLIEDQWDEEYFWEDFGLIALVLLGSIILNLLIFLDPLQWLLAP